MAVRFQVQFAERLFVLGEILSEHIPQGLGLLRTQEDRAVITDVHLFGAFAGGEPENELEVPHAHAHMHAVGIYFAKIGGLGNIELGLLKVLTHSLIRLTRPGCGALNHKAKVLVRKAGLEPASLAALAPKASVFAISPLPHFADALQPAQGRAATQV